MQNPKRIISWLLLASFFILFSFLVYNIQQIKAERGNLASIASSVSQPVVEEATLSSKKWNVTDPDISAASAISLVTNLVNRDEDMVLFSKNENAKLPIASLTKLMTAMIVLDTYDLRDNVQIDGGADAMDAVINDVKEGDIQSVNNLLHIMLISSSNKAAMALAEKVGPTSFVWLMNEKAKYIGLENTYFAEPTGLSGNNYSTSADLAKLAMYILKNYPKIVQITEIKEIELPGFGRLENTNKLLGKIPGIVIGKTGFTLDAKECLLLAIYNPNAKNYFINVVLGSDDRFTEMQDVINWVNEAYAWQKLP